MSIVTYIVLALNLLTRLFAGIIDGSLFEEAWSKGPKKKNRRF